MTITRRLLSEKSSIESSFLLETASRELGQDESAIAGAVFKLVIEGKVALSCAGKISLSKEECDKMERERKIQFLKNEILATLGDCQCKFGMTVCALSSRVSMVFRANGGFLNEDFILALAGLKTNGKITKIRVNGVVGVRITPRLVELGRLY